MENPAKRRILLGVTGGIAAYKSCLLLRRLVDAGCETRVVLTRNAAHFVSPLTFSTLSGHAVAADPFADYRVDGAEHIDLSAWADQFVVAPATANILGKAAQGIADDFLSTLICAFDKSIVFAPAMNHRMWGNAAVLRNVEQLKADGHLLVEPGSGYLACGETGAGRMAEPEQVHEWLDWQAWRSTELLGRVVVVSAGPTIEDIDEVRFLGNRSSGRMGFALARVAQRMGAEVRLVAGPVDLPTPLGVCRKDVRSAREMTRVIQDQVIDADLLVMCAAVADYSPDCQPGKRKKNEADWNLKLRPTEDILAKLGRNKGRRIHVGFALEVEAELENARNKLVRKNLDLICLNNPRREGSGMGSPTNQITLLDRAGQLTELPLLDKEQAAREILLRAARMLESLG